MIISVNCNSASKNDIGFSGCFPYGIDEGPCIFDDDCKDNLFCGYKNCPATFGNDDSNCCGLMQFKSPNYPNNYFNNDEKTWLITAPIESIIKLQFHNFTISFFSCKTIRHIVYISSEVTEIGYYCLQFL